jgi:hypothetical protein
MRWSTRSAGRPSQRRQPGRQFGGRSGSSRPSKREKAPADAAGLGGHCCCQTRSGMSASGSNSAASLRYSRRCQSRSRLSPLANSTRRAICRSMISGDPSTLTPIRFMRLWRPSASGRTPQFLSSASLTARQSSQPNQAHREVPPAVPLQQRMHKSRALETSQPCQHSGKSSSGHDCHRPLRSTGPRNQPHGICTDNSVIRSRRAASVALNRRSVMSGHLWRRHPRASTACTNSRAGSSPGAPCGGARLPERRARYPNSHPLLSFHKPSGCDRQPVGTFILQSPLHRSACNSCERGMS